MTSRRPVVATVLLGVVVGIGATAGGWCLRGAIQPVAPRSSSPEVVDDDLHAEIAHLRRELAETKARAAVLAIARATLEASVNDRRDPPSTAADHEVARETFQLSAEALLRRTEEQFRSESRDPAWSGPAEALARRHLSSPATGDRVHMDVECRASICRAEVVYPDAAAYERVAGSPSTETYEWAGGQSTSFPSRTADGKITVAHYLFRVGKDPRPDIYAEEEANAAATSQP